MRAISHRSERISSFLLEGKKDFFIVAASDLSTNQKVKDTIASISFRGCQSCLETHPMHRSLCAKRKSKKQYQIHQAKPCHVMPDHCVNQNVSIKPRFCRRPPNLTAFTANRSIPSFQAIRILNLSHRSPTRLPHRPPSRHETHCRDDRWCRLGQTGTCRSRPRGLGRRRGRTHHRARHVPQSRSRRRR
jgi:hypothetical protein